MNELCPQMYGSAKYLCGILHYLPTGVFRDSYQLDFATSSLTPGEFGTISESQFPWEMKAAMGPTLQNCERKMKSSRKDSLHSTFWVPYNTPCSIISSSSLSLPRGNVELRVHMCTAMWRLSSIISVKV